MQFITSPKYQTVTDNELLQAYKQQNATEALGALYQRYMELLYGVCVKYLKSNELAKDAVLNIYEELVVKLKKHEVENFKSWVYMLAKNHCLMYLRSPKNKETKEFMPESMQFTETVHLNNIMEKEASFTKLEQCLDTLDEVQKICVQQFYYQQKCYKDIADTTGYEQGMVRSYIQNGRRNLKKCMESN